MKKIMMMAALFMAVLSAGAQEQRAVEAGWVHSVGMGLKYASWIETAELSPEVSIGYRFNSKNTVGVTFQSDCSNSPDRIPLNVFLYHTYDFSDKPRSMFLQYEFGGYNLMLNPDWHVGFEAGYRFLIREKLPFRLAATCDLNRYFNIVDGRSSTVSLGVVCRVEL